MTFVILQKKDFTVDTVNFPSNEMKTFISKLHTDGQKYGTQYYIDSIWLRSLSGKFYVRKVTKVFRLRVCY